MSKRSPAVAAGTLLILGIITALIATSLTGPILSEPDYLSAIRSNESSMLWGAFFQLLTALGAPAIALSFYPVLKEHYPTIALGAVAFRTFEGVCYAISGLGVIALTAVGREYAAGPTEALQSIGNLIGDVSNATNFIFGVAAFGLGATLYSLILYVTILVPRWLTIWGFGGLILVVSAAMFTLFNSGSFAIEGNLRIFAAPIAVQELVLGGWLIVKGFSVQAAQQRA